MERKVNSPEGVTIYVEFAFMGVPQKGSPCVICGKPAVHSIFPMAVEEMIGRDYLNIPSDSILWTSQEFWFRRELERLVGSGVTCSSSICWNRLLQRLERISTQPWGGKHGTVHNDP